MAAEAEVQVVDMLRMTAASKAAFDTGLAIGAKLRAVVTVADGRWIAQEASKLGVPTGLVSPRPVKAHLGKAP